MIKVMCYISYFILNPTTHQLDKAVGLVPGVQLKELSRDRLYVDFTTGFTALGVLRLNSPQVLIVPENDCLYADPIKSTSP